MESDACAVTNIIKLAVAIEIRGINAQTIETWTLKEWQYYFNWSKLFQKPFKDKEAFIKVTKEEITANAKDF